MRNVKLDYALVFSTQNKFSLVWLMWAIIVHILLQWSQHEIDMIAINKI